MGMGCPLRFSRNAENGLKEVQILIPKELQVRRRQALFGARQLCEERGLDIPEEEVEAALIEGMWPTVLAPLDPTRRVTPVREPVAIYYQTLWDLRDYMTAAMVKSGKDKDGYGGVRAFYALLER